MIRSKTGTIKLRENFITELPAHRIVEMGVAMVPEGRKIFPNLTVMENLILGCYVRKDVVQIKKDMEWIFSIFPRLKERTWQKGGTLSGGEQQMLAVGRALMSRPQILMMDEPSLGLAPLLVKEIFHIIKQINQEGTTILLIEQNARAALEISDFAYVMETGKITISGEGKNLLIDEKVRKAYLGED